MTNTPPANCHCGAALPKSLTSIGVQDLQDGTVCSLYNCPHCRTTLASSPRRAVRVYVPGASVPPTSRAVSILRDAVLARISELQGGAEMLLALVSPAGEVDSFTTPIGADPNRARSETALVLSEYLTTELPREQLDEVVRLMSMPAPGGRWGVVVAWGRHGLDEVALVPTVIVTSTPAPTVNAPGGDA